MGRVGAHSAFYSERSGPYLVAVTEGRLENPSVASRLNLADFRGRPSCQSVCQLRTWSKTAGKGTLGFQVSLLKLLPELTILNRMLSEAGDLEKFGLP